MLLYLDAVCYSYAPARPSATYGFFLSLRRSLPLNAPFIRCGASSYVENLLSDVRAPGRGRPPWNARELRRLFLFYSISDYFALLRAQVLLYTWSCGQPARRLDRYYCCPALASYVINCDVFLFSVDVEFVTDHRPVCLELCLSAPPLTPVAPCRFDISLFYGVVAFTSLR